MLAPRICPLRRCDHNCPLADLPNVFAGNPLRSMTADVARHGETQGADLMEAGGICVPRVDAKPYRGPEGHWHQRVQVLRFGPT